MAWSLWALTTICHQLGLDHHNRSQGTWSTFLGYSSQHFLKHWLKWGAKGFIFSGTWCLGLILTRKLSLIRKANSRIFSLSTPGLSFGLQTDHNLAETVIRTFPAQKNWFSIAPWFFHNSLVNDYVHFGLVNCAIIYRFRFRVLRHHEDQLGWASCLSPQGPKDWINNQAVITSIFFTPEWLPKSSRLKAQLWMQSVF